jgi:hypothetical protein
MREDAITDGDVIRHTSAAGVTPATMFSRRAVQEVHCSRCHAGPGMACMSSRGRPRTSNHLERCFDRIRLQLATEPRR